MQNLWLYLLSAVIFFSRGIAGLPSSSFFFYLKEQLHYNEQTIMYLGSFISLAWCIKPIIGYYVDILPFTKKSWMLFSFVACFILTLILGINSFLPLVIILMMLISSFEAIQNISNDGLMVVAGQKHGITGRVQAIQWGALTFASIITGVLGGWMSEHYSYQFCYLCLLPFYVIMFLVTMKYKEEVVEKKNILSMWQSTKLLWNDKNLMLVCLFIFLYNFSPSFGVPLSFIQRDTFHWTRTFMGLLGTISAIGCVIGSAIYWKVSKKLDIKKWLIFSVWTGAVTSLLYLYYTPLSAVIYDIMFSVVGMFIQLLVLDFMAQKSKIALAATTFALLCSVSNLTGTLNSFIGGFLYPIIGLQWLIIISSFTSFLCLPVIKRLKYD
jgi:MFS family permease